MHAPSVLRPSAAAAIVQCSGSKRMQDHFPEDEDGPEAREGRAAHWALSERLAGQLVAEGQITPEGTVLTREMIESAEDCYDDITHTLGENWRAVVRSEVPVKLTRIYPGMWGTPDVQARLTPRLRYVWDFKHGHRYVDPFENWQLLCYALDDAEPFNDPEEVIVFKIVQPRSYHRSGTVREWRVFAKQLAPYLATLRQAAANALGPSPTLRTGPACENCSARYGCPAAIEAAYQAAEVSGKAVPMNPTPHALGLMLRDMWRASDRLKAVISGLEAQAESLHRAGQPVPFTSMVNGRKSTVWTVPDSEVISVGRMIGKDLAKPAEAITPKQAEKAGFSAELLAAYSKEIPGALKLAAEDSTRARQVFGQQPGPTGSLL